MCCNVPRSLLVHATRNVTHLVLRETERASSVSIDGQKLAVKGEPRIALTKSGDRWTTGDGDAGAD